MKKRSKAEAQSTLYVPGRLDMRLAWLRLNARQRTVTAHVFHDYLESSFGDRRPFLAALAACGKRRDERLRVPPDPLNGRPCKTCLRHAADEVRWAGERTEVFQKYGIKKGSRR